MTDSETVQEREVFEAGVQAVIYGLPLVMMDLTMKRATNVTRPTGAAAPTNQFAAMRAFPTAAFKEVVRANVDTLYSSAFLDLSTEPVVLSVPDTNDRYYLLPMFDAWTNVFATPGKRTTGAKSGRFVITGPGWTGRLPPGLTELKSPTNTVWILGRTQTNGPDDYPSVHAIQDGYTLVPLSTLGQPYTAPPGVVDPTVDMTLPPVEQLQRMSAADFFCALARLLKWNPPSPADAPMLAKLARVGIVPGETFDPARHEPPVARGLSGCVTAALQKLHEDVRAIGTGVNGWRIPPKELGNFGANHGLRAAIALMAFGANLPADAIYPTTFADADGHALDGINQYTLHFEHGSLPPVHAFWSVTLYDPQSFFVDNPARRYAISSWMPLQQNADGSVDLHIQHGAPDADKSANWLPAPEGGFNLTMRMYWPTSDPPSILDGSWTPPAVTRV